jgi:crossover junction endodeoxyribonuclease RuvC
MLMARTVVASTTGWASPRSIEPVFDVVLGIDPGVSRCGYGAVSRDGSRFTATLCGVIRTAPSDPLPHRLALLAAELDALIAETRPVAIAVERVLFQVNARTAMSVGQASGLALAIAGRERIPVVQYSPNEVKLAVAGDGGADKREVGEMVARLLGLREVPGPADVTDALALAVCHWWRVPLQVAVAADTRGSSRLEAAITAAVQRERSDR